MKFEFATSLNQIVGSFNTNTNLWTKLYIFKRLIFLGNKNLSALGALFFLALWHGIHSGYYFCFFLEYIDIETEKRWSKRLEPYTKQLYDPKNKSDPTITILRRLHEFACWFYQTCGLHYAMISFELLKWNRVVSAYNSVYWIGHIIVFTLLLADIILPRKRVKKVDSINSKLGLNEKTKLIAEYVNGTNKIKEL